MSAVEPLDEADPLGGKTPLAYVMECLADKAEGKPVDEERMGYAVALSACATLVRQGLDVDTAMEVVESAMSKGDIRVHYSEEDGLEVEFGEGIVKGQASSDAEGSE